MSNIKHPDFIAITIFFIIIGILYKYPSIFIFYLITLFLLSYITYVLTYHKIIGINLINKMKESISYINRFEEKLNNSINLINILKETEFELMQLPKNKKKFYEKIILENVLFFQVNALSTTLSKINFLEEQESAENALSKVFYDIS